MRSTRRTMMFLALATLASTAPAQRTRARRPRLAARTLLRFLPPTMGGAPADERTQADDVLVHAAYRTEAGYINVNLALTRSPTFDEAQLRGAESDAFVVRPGTSSRGVAVGRFRALYVAYRSGSQTVLSLFLSRLINVRVSVEGGQSPEQMVALALELDLEGLDALARRVPAPPRSETED